MQLLAIIPLKYYELNLFSRRADMLEHVTGELELARCAAPH